MIPPRPLPALPDADARDYALRRFRDFLASLIYQRRGENGLTIPFRLPKTSIHVYQPDDVRTVALPGFGFVPARGVHDAISLGPPTVIDSSKDVYGQGTVLVRKSDYTETFALEAWGSKHAERRALIAGVTPRCAPSDSSYALQLKLPQYFNQVASYSLDESQYVDDDNTVRNRRRGHLFIKLQVCEVGLINYTNLNAQLSIEVLDGNLYPTLDC